MRFIPLLLGVIHAVSTDVPLDANTKDECERPADLMIHFYAGLSNNITKLDIMAEEETSINWGNLMGPGPAAIACLSSLVLVTANNDVNLTDGLPKGKAWDKIERPGSLRASLAQVANNAHDALLAAHVNMNKILQYTKIGKTRFRDVKDMFLTKDVKTRERQLPLLLQQLSDITPECKRLAEDTVHQFAEVSAVITELMEGCISSHSVKKNEKLLAQQSLELLAITNNTIVKHIETVTKDKNKAEKRMDEALAELTRAIKNKPTFFDYLGGAICDMVSTFRPAEMISSIIGMAAVMKAPGLSAGLNMLKGAGENVRIGGTRIRSGLKSFKTDTEDVSATDMSEIAQLIVAYRQNVDLQIPLRLINAYGDRKSDNTSSIKNAINTLSRPIPLLQTLSATSKERHPTVGITSQQLTKFLNSGTNILKQLQEKVTGSISLDENSLDPLKQKAKKWETKGAEFKAMFDRIASTPKNKPVRPEMYDKAVQSPDTAAKINAAYKTQIAANEKLYRATSDRYDKEVERLDAYNKQSMELLEKMKNLQFREHNLAEAIKTLKEAIGSLGVLQKQWMKLQMFFHDIATIIGTQWYTRVNGFIDIVKKYANDPDSTIYIANNVLYNKAFEAARLNYRVMMLARTYMKVSTHYLMPPLQEVPTLFHLEIQSDIDKKQQNITRTLATAQANIRSLLVSERNRTRTELEEYVQYIEKNFAGLCKDKYPRKEKEEDEFAKRVGDGTLALNDALNNVTMTKKDIFDPYDDY